MPNNEDYLNKLIAKAKKSWEGVDVDSYMSGLRDNSFNKEVAVLPKEVASYITEQAKYNRLKIIEERAERYAIRPLIPDSTIPADIANEQRNAYIAGAKEQKAIDDAKLLKLKSAWEKQAQINHDDEANYQQGYHDAIEKALDWFSNYLDYLNMGICDENDWLRGSPESGKERFRKAMEE